MPLISACGVILHTRLQETGPFALFSVDQAPVGFVISILSLSNKSCLRALLAHFWYVPSCRLSDGIEVCTTQCTEKVHAHVVSYTGSPVFLHVLLHYIEIFIAYVSVCWSTVIAILSFV